MLDDLYQLGSLVWADFEFPSDEENTLHPGIVLQDQGEKVLVISGSSLGTPDHLVIRNEKFTSFVLSPRHVTYDYFAGSRFGIFDYNEDDDDDDIYCEDDYEELNEDYTDYDCTEGFISRTTYFQLDELKAVAKNKIERHCGELDSNSLDILMGRCAMRSCFSHNSIGDEEEIHKWDLICWMDEEDSEMRSYLNLNDLKFAVVVGKIKDSRLKILAEVTHGEDSENTTVMRDVTPSNDLDELVLNSKPSILHRDKVCFVIGKITKFERSRLQRSPHLRVKSKQELTVSDSSELKIGDVVCAKKSPGVPRLIVGMGQNGNPITVKGVKTTNKTGIFVSTQEITGFSHEYKFTLDSEPILTKSRGSLFKLQDSKLLPEQIAYLSCEPSIMLHSAKPFDPDNQILSEGDIVCHKLHDWESIRIPWLIIGGDEHHYYALEGKSFSGAEVTSNLILELEGYTSPICFNFERLEPLNKYKIKFKHSMLPKEKKKILLSSNLYKAYKSV